MSDKALLASVVAETIKLDRYIDNLVDLRPVSEHKPLELGPLTIDLHRRAVLKDGTEVHLTPKGMQR